MNNIEGLTKAEVEQRIANGEVNIADIGKTKSYRKIICDNVFTLFNFINVILAILILTTHSYRNLLFLGVVIVNLIIGITQEIRAKKTLDKINLIVSSKVKVLRDGQFKLINVEEVVKDDIVALKMGNQIIADAIVIDGNVEVDESLLTGESDVINKKVGDKVLSGSFVVSGECLVKIIHVGNENYAAQLTKQTRKYNRYPSELRDTLNKIIKYIGIAIIPLGCLLFAKQIVHHSYDETILGVSGALIGMIPEGLVVLTSIALAVSVINLAKKKTLVQELYCIETLARVDTLCLDKTGTITQGCMEVECYDNIEFCDHEKILRNLGYALKDENPTIDAIRNYVGTSNDFTIKSVVPFSSKRKFSGVNFKNHAYAIGAYEFIFQKRDSEIDKIIADYAKKGKRVITLAKADEINELEVINPQLLGLIIIVDKIRPSAKDTIDYFKKQGVDIKIISGDNPLTVSEVAHRAGVSDYDKYVDAQTLSDDDLKTAIEKYTIFGRVTPQQKKLMVQALKENKHTVAMTGDGVNDVLAFKEANVSIAMASGSEMAKNTANLVLLDSNFDALPAVLNEGRRVINNIQNVATLFLNKTIYSCLLCLLFIFLPFSYPFTPINLTFVSTLTIGIPSFFLALEPNYHRVDKRFTYNIFHLSLPAALGIVSGILLLSQLQATYPALSTYVPTIGTTLLCVVGMSLLFIISRPFTLLRKIIFITMGLGIILGFIYLHNLFNLHPMGLIKYHILAIIILIFSLVISYLVYKFVSKLQKN